jgi:hypothetical protein
MENQTIYFKRKEKGKRATYWLTVKNIEKIKTLAKANGLSEGNVVNQIIDEFNKGVKTNRKGNK